MAEPASKKRKGNWGSGIQARPKKGQMFRRKAGGASRLPTAVYTAGGKPGKPMTFLNSFMPQKKTCIMHYADQYNVSNLAVGTRFSQTMRGNSVYDPDQTGTGHQPRGYDQISALYRYYSVKSSSIRVRFGTTAVGCASLVGLQADASTEAAPVSSTISEFLESYPYNQLLSNTDGSAATATLTDKRTTAAMSSNPAVDGDNIAVVTTNPANEWYWKIVVFNAHTTSALYGTVFVDVWYEVEFSEPVEQAES